MNYPRHIAIIPDGNRTWAKEHNLPSIFWHKAWFETAKELVAYCFKKTSIEIATLRGASTENIKERSAKELEYLYEIYQMISKEMVDLHDNYGIWFKWIGSTLWLPKNLVDFFHHQEKTYPSKDGKYYILAVNYGGRDEIMRGIQQFQQNHPNQTITEEALSQSMDLWSLPPIELVIRTKGKMAKRLSGFMTRWIGYAELYFSDLYFPDFHIPQLQEALKRFDSIVEHRNFWK